MKKIILLVCSFVGINQAVKAQNPVTFIMEADQALDQMLVNVKNSFELKNQAYLVNISIDNIVVLQLIHPNMFAVTSNPDKTFGITTLLNFHIETEHNAFKNSQDVSSYIKNDFDGIPSYLKNYITDIESAKTDIINILKNVYGIKDTTMIEIQIYDQGPIQYVIPN